VPINDDDLVDFFDHEEPREEEEQFHTLDDVENGGTRNGGIRTRTRSPDSSLEDLLMGNASGVKR
jgi:hypothetical protein